MKRFHPHTRAARFGVGGLALALVFIMACAALAPAAAPAEDDAEASLCKAAFSRCMGEAIVSGLLTGGGALFYYVSFCLIGWDFCQRYIQA
jgi:hypothetical protein